MRCLLLSRSFERLPLRWAFLRGSLSIALISVAMVGVTVILVSVLMLRAYSQHNLRLIARSVAYTVEAAVVFNDVQAVKEGLQAIVSKEAIAEAQVYDSQGNLLASYQRPQMLVSWLVGGSYQGSLAHQGIVIGEVRLLGDTRSLLGFIAVGLGSVVVSLLVAAVLVHYLTQKMVDKVVEPLENMTRITRAIRIDRDFARHVPQKTNLSELNDLGEDFNALLDELCSWQAHIQMENRMLAHKARHDSLTGLPNRSFFEYRLNSVLQDAARQSKQAALLFIDCDQFKTINDTLGHAVGDKVLVDVATRIRNHLRETDLVARLGGDEFAALIYPVPKTKDAVRIADAIVSSMSRPIDINDGDSICTGLSIGIALYPQHGRTTQQLLHSADTAMYLAKRAKRGRRRTTGAVVA